MEQFLMKPIGKIKVNRDNMFIELDPEYIPALQALDGFSHLNILWWFSDSDYEEARNTLEVLKPYKKAPPVMGTFATRAPYRPNPIGLTTAEVIYIDRRKGIIQVAYIDAVDGTPVLDIKPYTPSLDRVKSPGVPEWCGHWPASLEQSGNFNWEEEFNY